MRTQTYPFEKILVVSFSLFLITGISYANDSDDEKINDSCLNRSPTYFLRDKTEEDLLNNSSKSQTDNRTFTQQMREKYKRTDITTPQLGFEKGKRESLEEGARNFTRKTQELIETMEKENEAEEERLEGVSQALIDFGQNLIPRSIKGLFQSFLKS